MIERAESNLSEVRDGSPKDQPTVLVLNAVDDTLEQGELLAEPEHLPSQAHVVVQFLHFGNEHRVSLALALQGGQHKLYEVLDYPAHLIPPLP